MYSFILNKQPKSYNSWRKADPTKKATYKADIQNALIKFHPTHTTATKEEMYGLLYYFFKKDTDSDADNLSKPIWDCLTNFLFIDDKQIRLRIAGSFDLNKNDFSILNLTGLSGDVATELLDSFDEEDHFVYIECGKINNLMFKFNIE